MKFFKKREKKQDGVRSIDEMFTPKDDNEDEVEELCEEKENEVREEAGSEREAEEDMKDKALNCFGWKEVNTESWLIKCANVWYVVASFLWFLFGALTFAPVIFISGKVNLIFKDKKKSFICSIILYVALIVLFIVFLVSRSTPEFITTP